MNVDNEAVAIMFEIQKLNTVSTVLKVIYYYTDHKSLLGIFDSKPVSNMTSSRLVGIAYVVSSHGRKIIYISDPEIGNADALRSMATTKTRRTRTTNRKSINGCNT
ncbi:unnamed protein product [Parnassius mnemosyne]|uniref:Uncharacterized protein n=1 Tax=Parnassius mnemosyne TaxID=213953 RepID=A0AAV1KIQ6_9NEOP